LRSHFACESIYTRTNSGTKELDQISKKKKKRKEKKKKTKGKKN
jgi:hypothetical protein